MAFIEAKNFFLEAESPTLSARWVKMISFRSATKKQLHVGVLLKKVFSNFL